MSHRVLIVGAGLTGSVCACTLRREMQRQVKVEVWDKARGPGGRMSTSRLESQSADLGAQYITATPAYASSHSRSALGFGRSFTPDAVPGGSPAGGKSRLTGSERDDWKTQDSVEDPSSYFSHVGMDQLSAWVVAIQDPGRFCCVVDAVSFYAELMRSGVLRPLDALIEGLQQNDENKNYVSPGGVSAVVRHFLSHSGTDVFFEHHVTGLYCRGASWEVQRKNCDSRLFDAVVLTMPVPQILQLQGDVGKLLTIQQRAHLHSVVYSSRFALALFFGPDISLSFPWAARYVTDNHCVRYIAADLSRRHTDASGVGPSLVVHTSVQFGLEHLEWDEDKVQPIILQELHKLLPGLPQPVSIKCHKWRYSQVLTSFPDCPGHMTVCEKPLLICGGDAFVHSNFDGCVESALRMTDVLTVALQS